MQLTIGGNILSCRSHEAVVVLRLVILVELIEFDQFYQLVSIARIGGIACSLKTSSPSLVVCCA